MSLITLTKKKVDRAINQNGKHQRNRNYISAIKKNFFVIAESEGRDIQECERNNESSRKQLLTRSSLCDYFMYICPFKTIAII